MIVSQTQWAGAGDRVFQGDAPLGRAGENSGANVIGIDHGIEMAEAERRLPRDIGLQGNLNPALLTGAKPATVAAETRRLLELMRGRNGYIFNLGHGVPPEAKMENLEALVA